MVKDGVFLVWPIRRSDIFIYVLTSVVYHLSEFLYLEQPSLDDGHMGTCPSGWMTMPGYSEGCYTPVNFPNPSWPEAEVHCAGLLPGNSYLVSVESTNKAAAIKAALVNSSWFSEQGTGNTNIWVGARDKDNSNTFYWLGSETEASDPSVWGSWPVTTSDTDNCVWLSGSSGSILTYHCNPVTCCIKGFICQLF